MNRGGWEGSKAEGHEEEEGEGQLPCSRGEGGSDIVVVDLSGKHPHHKWWKTEAYTR